MKNRLLFNFAASYSGGGYKRLYEYAKWFDANDGAWFVIHPNCRGLIGEFPNNRFFVVRQSYAARLWNDCAYLGDIGEIIGKPELYYSYGIPIYSRFGAVNWFHLSNVLPLSSEAVPVPALDRFKLRLLGSRIRRAYSNADVVSAESAYSLGLMRDVDAQRLFISVNGSDDELQYLREKRAEDRESMATVLGTRSHKAIADSYLLFQALKTRSSDLRLVVIGEKQFLPGSLLNKPDVEVRGVLARTSVLESLRKSKYYISTTLIENSYNAASEGIFLADESYISDIGPHRELLVDCAYAEVRFALLDRPFLHVRKDDLTGRNLKSWSGVITDMLERFRAARQNQQARAEHD